MTMGEKKVKKKLGVCRQLGVGEVSVYSVVMQSGNGSAGVGAVLVHFSAKDLVVDWDKVHDLEFVRKLSVPRL